MISINSRGRLLYFNDVDYALQNTICLQLPGNWQNVVDADMIVSSKICGTQHGLVVGS